MKKYASWKKRLVNYIIDTFSIFLLFNLILELLPYFAKYIPFDFEMSFDVILLIIFVSYYIIFEGIAGKTLGKLLTKTKVQSHDGNKPKFINIIIRTLVRLIFIEVISFFTQHPLGWHDSLSKTQVIEL